MLPPVAPHVPIPVFATLLLVACVLALVWTWVIYPTWMIRGARSAGTASTAGLSVGPCSVLIATREPPQVVAARFANILETTTPGVIGEMLLAIDVSSVFPLSEYQDAVAGRATVLVGDAPGGKAATLNSAVRRARFDIIVLADSSQRFVDGAIAAVVAPLSDPSFGGVSGSVQQDSGDDAIDRYWRMDSMIRARQAAMHSVVTTTGQIAAFRRTLYPVLPAGLICDDLYATAHVILHGHRVGFAPRAVALDGRTFNRAQTLQRKMRTLTGLVQTCRLMPTMLNPLRNPVWMHVYSQKILRVLSPVFLGVGGWAFLAIVGVLMGWPTPSVIALLAFAPLLVVYLSAEQAARLLGPAAFLWVPLRALRNGLAGRFDVWEHHVKQQGLAPVVPGGVR